jgi:16S rRNA (cytidine1402-2'-O)-methyltransferase
MPLKSPIHDQEKNGGILYVVAVPIGNRDDITLRALKVLDAVALVAAEDTRLTGRFLNFHGIRPRLISYHEHNESQRTPVLIRQLRAGKSVALVTNAGTPAVSDPGYRLISTARAAGFRVVPVPGVSAAIAALSVSGLPTDAFVFVGFPAKKTRARLQQLASLSGDTRTLIFYESPKRIVRLVEELISLLGERSAFLAREMTKTHEEFIRAPLSELLHALAGRTEIKGECTLLVTGARQESPATLQVALGQLKKELQDKDLPLSTLVKSISKTHGVSKNDLYSEAVKLRKALEEGKG